MEWGVQGGERGVRVETKERKGKAGERIRGRGR